MLILCSVGVELKTCGTRLVMYNVAPLRFFSPKRISEEEFKDMEERRRLEGEKRLNNDEHLFWLLGFWEEKNFKAQKKRLIKEGKVFRCRLALYKFILDVACDYADFLRNFSKSGYGEEALCQPSNVFVAIRNSLTSLTSSLDNIAPVLHARKLTKEDCTNLHDLHWKISMKQALLAAVKSDFIRTEFEPAKDSERMGKALYVIHDSGTGPAGFPAATLSKTLDSKLPCDLWPGSEVERIQIQTAGVGRDENNKRLLLILLEPLPLSLGDISNRFFFNRSGFNRYGVFNCMQEDILCPFFECRYKLLRDISFCLFEYKKLSRNLTWDHVDRSNELFKEVIYKEKTIIKFLSIISNMLGKKDLSDEDCILLYHIHHRILFEKRLSVSLNKQFVKTSSDWPASDLLQCKEVSKSDLCKLKGA